MGIDQATAWNIADRLWYKSRLGSGERHNCALPASDGCSGGSWFQKLRIDDNDGNLANSTPHAAPCRLRTAQDRPRRRGDASTRTPRPARCSTAHPFGNGPARVIHVDAVPGTLGTDLRNGSAAKRPDAPPAGELDSLTDFGLSNGFTVYYTVQAFVSNSHCDGPLSNCQALTPQPFAGSVALDEGVYGCSSQITVTVIDSNIGSNTTTADLVSTTESAPETITLTRVSPGSATYMGTINATFAAPSHNGQLSVANGDTITATYIDASDGAGGVNLSRTAGATTACASLGAKPVADGSFGTAMTGSRADASGSTIDLTWDVSTCSSADHHLLYGDLANVASLAVAGAVCDLGTSGSASWTGVPAGDLWFVVVGDDDASTEGSWGTDGTGAQRGGSSPSARCGMATRDNSGVCP
jgi:hypothetical protein